MDSKIEAIVLVTGETAAMADFYTAVFDVRFETVEVEGSTIHEGRWAGLDLALIPQALSEVQAGQNPVHFDIYVDDLDEAIARVERHGGRTNGHLGEDEEVRAIGVFDPDGNFMVLKQRK
jgi:predicted enzyme related to lactoylglutathione lyase